MELNRHSKTVDLLHQAQEAQEKHFAIIIQNQ